MMRRPLGLFAAAAALATIAAPMSPAQAATASLSSGVGQSGSFILSRLATTASSFGAAAVGSAQENEVVRLVNARRAKKKGCRALKHHRQLHRAARGHSVDMVENNYFSSTDRDGRTFMDRIREAGFTGGTSFAENIGKGQGTPAKVVQSWMEAPVTKAAIMNCKFTFIGVGAAEDSNGVISWTQDFAAK
ncbi:hypothetical protein GCM10009850_051550 [Nonomuraea monospora]|uniref:SCP domain-containing protein n=1 Tax=Nonomuraea monospora TaxID=568818 RepID=A0ABP5PDC4_9ACTN